MSKIKDLTGQVFGRLTVLKIFEKDKNNKITWECQCSCDGKIIVVIGGDLKSGRNKSCGCINKEKSKDLTGLTFTRLTVLQKLGTNKHGKIKYLCECMCGVKKEIVGSDLSSGKIKSCGCLRKESREDLIIDISGQRFERLLVLDRVESKDGYATFLCKCDCGNEKIIRGYDLRSNKVKSCGCLHKEKLIKYNEDNKKKYNAYDLTGEYGIGYTTKCEEFYFDLEDYDKIKDYCWMKMIKNDYLINRINNKTVFLHRLILNIDEVDEEDVYGDHINGVRFDCRKQNLRVVKKQENAMNLKLRDSNKYGCKGLYFYEEKNVWQSTINYKNKCYYLGRHTKIEDAIHIREIAELILFGEYSRRYEELKEKYKDEDLTKYKFNT